MKNGTALTLSLKEIKEIHKREYPGVILSYFIEEYCNKQFESNHELREITIEISKDEKRIYRSTESLLKVVR